MISTIAFANFGTSHKLTKSAGKLAGAEFNLADLSAIVGFPILAQPMPMPINGPKANFSIRNGADDKPVDPVQPGMEPNDGPIQKSKTTAGQLPILSTGSLSDKSFSVTNTAEPLSTDSPKQSNLNVLPVSETGKLPATTAQDVTEMTSGPSTIANQPKLAAGEGKTEPIATILHQQKTLNAEPIVVQSKRENTLPADETDQTKVSILLPGSIDRGQESLLYPQRIQPLVLSTGGGPLFKEVSKIIKADDHLKVSTTPKLFTESKTVGPVLLYVLRPDSQEPLVTAISEAGSADIFDDASETGLTNIQITGSKTEKSHEAVLRLANLKATVFEQVEPRILELAAVVRNGDESRIIKLRLNPHELGAVDVTLEKSSTGKIDAHFRTESQDAQQILGENLVNLRNSLENAGWTVGELEISCNSFSSNGDEYREENSHKFGSSENHPAETTNLDGNLITEGVLEDRLVNLRA